MGKRRQKENRSQTLPPSPSHSFSSSSSSDFEFTISLSPRKSTANIFRPADELFYKGQLLPLHLSPRLSMVRTLILASSSSSSSDSATTASRDSSGSSNDSHASFSSSDAVLLNGECGSSRPSSVTEEDGFRRVDVQNFNMNHQIKKVKYFSLSRFSSVFRKEPKIRDPDAVAGSPMKRASSSAKEVIRKYMKKVKPLYEKLSPKNQQKLASTTKTATTTTVSLSAKTERSVKDVEAFSRKESSRGFSHSFSGNLRYPRRRSCVSSCPSSMRSSPSHSGVLNRNGVSSTERSGLRNSDSSTMEELQSAIQGAIAHCKNSMVPPKTMVSNEI